MLGLMNIQKKLPKIVEYLKQKKGEGGYYKEELDNIYKNLQQFTKYYYPYIQKLTPHIKTKDQNYLKNKTII